MIDVLICFTDLDHALVVCDIKRYGVNTLDDSGVHTIGDTSAFVNPTVQLLLTRQGKIRMDGVGIVYEFYVAPL